MNSPDSFPETYRLDFPNTTWDRVSQKTRGIINGQLLKPTGYEVEVKYITPTDILTQMGVPVPNISPKEFIENFFGISLEVFALNNVLINRSQKTRNLLLRVVYDKSTADTIIPFKGLIYTWVQIGCSHLFLDYLAGSGPSASLESAELMKRYTGPLNERIYNLTRKQLGKLNLANSGIPEEFHWRNTLRRYRTRTQPDANGDFNQGRPLTAEDIYANLLLAT